MKKILIPVSFLVLLALDIMAVDAIRSSNEGMYLFGWLAILISVVIYALFAFNFLSKSKKK